MRRLLPLLLGIVLFLAGLSLGLTVKAATPRSAQGADGLPGQTGVPLDPAFVPAIASGDARPVVTPSSLVEPGKRPGSEAQPTAKPSAATSKHRLTPRQGRDGLASTYGPGWDGWIAWPAGPGYRLRVCGAGGCLTVVSTDAGPAPAMLRPPYNRVIDLDVRTFEAVCGIPWWPRGLCRVTVRVLGRG